MAQKWMKPIKTYVRIMLTVQNNKFEAVKILGEQEAQIDKTQEKGGPVLRFAADNKGNDRIVLYLIKDGANVNIQDSFFGRPI